MPAARGRGPNICPYQRDVCTGGETTPLRILRSTLRGEAVASPSKSYTHRAFVIGALTGSRFQAIRPLLGDDTKATLAAIAAMGAEIELENDIVKIECPRLKVPKHTIDAMNSGTTMRIVSGIAGLLDGKTTISGDESLRKRPMKPLLSALRDLGAECSGTGDSETPPVTIKGPMDGTEARIPGDISSQFISSLLIACPIKKTATSIKISGEQKSRSYVDITLDMLRRFRVEVEKKPTGFEMKGGQRPVGSRYEIPGDFSSAAFLFCGAAMTEGNVRISGLDSKLPQGDKKVMEALSMYGADVTILKDNVMCLASGKKPFDMDIGDSPDLFPILAVLAATAKGNSKLHGGSHLKFKESDRISSTVNMLKSLGVEAVKLDDGCVVKGTGRIRGGKVDTLSDHRIMMSAVIAGLCSEQGVVTSDDSSYSVSYPSFLEDVQRLGAKVEATRE